MASQYPVDTTIQIGHSKSGDSITEWFSITLFDTMYHTCILTFVQSWPYQIQPNSFGKNTILGDTTIIAITTIPVTQW